MKKGSIFLSIWLGFVLMIPAQAKTSNNLESRLSAQVANATYQASSFNYALDVQVNISTDQGEARSFHRPAVVVGKKHLLMYLGELKQGEIIRSLRVENKSLVFDFKAAYNNVWVTEQELYRAFDQQGLTRLPHVVLLLSLRYEINNFAYGVFGMDMKESSAKIDFLQGIAQSMARRTNILGIWDRLIEVEMEDVVLSGAGVPVYHTSGVHWVQREGEPLFIKFTQHNAFGMPTTWWMLAGFKMKGENAYWGFSHAHMRQGRKWAPDVTWFGH